MSNRSPAYSDDAYSNEEYDDGGDWSEDSDSSGGTPPLRGGYRETPRKGGKTRDREKDFNEFQQVPHVLPGGKETTDPSILGFKRDGTVDVQSEHSRVFVLGSLFRAHVEYSWFWYFLSLFLFFVLISLVFAGVTFVDSEQVVDFDTIETIDFMKHWIYHLGRITNPMIMYQWTQVDQLATTTDEWRGVTVFEVWLVRIALIIYTMLAFIRMKYPNPNPHVFFSDSAVLHKHYNEKAFSVRIGNQGPTLLGNVKISLLARLSHWDQSGHKYHRNYSLEVANPSMHTIINTAHVVSHRIDRASPLSRISPNNMMDLEVTAILDAVDGKDSRRCHAVKVYRPKDIEWDETFAEMTTVGNDGHVIYKFDKFNKTK